MDTYANVSDSSHVNSGSQLKHIALQIVEAIKGVSPTLFWKLKVWRIRRHFSEYELRLAPFLCHMRKISVDIGASEGTYSVNICKHSATCVAFEPRPIQAARIREMALFTGLPIQVEAVALSDSAGSACMRILAKDLGRSTIESANLLEDPDGSPQASIQVQRMRLDDYGLREVGFIKIDVEGHELAVLMGAEETIRASKPNLLVEIEERHRTGAIEEVSAFLAHLGYLGFFILNGEILPLARFDKSVHQNRSNIGSWKTGWKRRGVYVNNFFFLPVASVGVLSAAVLSAN